VKRKIIYQVELKINLINKEKLVKSKNQDTILIVDDEAINVELIGNMLETKYKIQTATSGKEAIASAIKSPPELILLDIIMPKMDGFEVCKQLKENPETADIPVIFLSAKNEEKDEAKGFMLGAVDYIKKPFRPLVDLQRLAVHIELGKQKKLGFYLKHKNIGNYFDIEAELKAIYKLTPSEARLCNDLVNGYTLEETAKKVGLQYCTLRGYLKQIFRKTDTNKQHELVSTIMKDLILYV
jgi:CheY-like chemotaxis protein/DNA-binding CsgD family transcriptional regulator